MRFPSPDSFAAFGGKLSGATTHFSRTMMWTELERVLSVASLCNRRDFERAIVQDNVTGKRTESTRQKTFRHLRELYGLDDAIPIFHGLAFLYRFDRKALPLLACQCAWSRDVLFRATTRAVVGVHPGATVNSETIEAELRERLEPGYSPQSLARIARNAVSSWTQSGHLGGARVRVRVRIKPAPAAVAYALALASAAGYEGAALFESPFCRLLDLPPTEARDAARQAHRDGLITLRAVGSVVDIGFPFLDQSR